MRPLTEFVWRKWPGRLGRHPDAQHLYLLQRGSNDDIRLKACKYATNSGQPQAVHPHMSQESCNGQCEFVTLPDQPLPYPIAAAVAEVEQEQERIKLDDLVDRAAVVLHHEDAKMPTRAYDGDAGFDLHYCGADPLTVEPGDTVYVPARVAIQWPEGVWAMVIGRSSSFVRGLLVNPAIIDAGYRGELWAYTRNIGTDPVTIEPGDRVAQIVPMPLVAASIELQQVGCLDDSDRGAAGIGSSGK